MAWGYGPSRDSGEDPDYSSLHDYSEDNPDYSNMSDGELNDRAARLPDQDALRNDILSGDSGQTKSPIDRVRDTFRDEYRKNRQSLGNAERSEGALANKAGKLQSDLSKKENALNDKTAAWKTNLEAKRQNAISASKNKQGSFFSRHKKGVTGWLIGLVMAGGMSIFMLPSIAIAEFGQIANWVKQTTQTVHEVVTGARSMRNVLVSAKVAAKAAISAGSKSYFQTSRVGTQ